MKTTAVKYVWCIFLPCNMIMSMEQIPTSATTYATEYYLGHKLEWSTEHSDGITHIAYSPLKEQPFFIVGSEDNSISLWHEDGTSGFQTTTEQKRITALAIRPDAQEIAVGTSGDRQSVILYDANTGTIKNLINLTHDEQANYITDISYSPLGDLCAVMQNGTTFIWDRENIEPVTRIPSSYHACSARILPDNVLRIVTQAGKIYTFPITQPHILEKINMRKGLPVTQTISRPFLSQDGQECVASFIPQIAYKPNEIIVCIFDILHKTFVSIKEGRGISHAAFSQDRSVCASIFGRMLTTYHRISEPGFDGFNHIVTHSSTPSTTATALACSPDGSHMVTSLRPQTIALWRLIKECRTVKDK